MLLRTARTPRHAVGRSWSDIALRRIGDSHIDKDRRKPASRTLTVIRVRDHASPMTERLWDRKAHPFWHGSAHMSFVLDTAGYDEVFVSADGSWLVDRSGRRYLDGRSGMGNMILGYGRRDIAEAMFKQALELPFVGTVRYERAVDVVVEYAAALVDVAPAPLRRVRFSHTGSSAVETALMIARRYHALKGQKDRNQIISLEDSFHGTTLMTIASSGATMLQSGYGPMPDGFHCAARPAVDSCATCTGNPEGGSTCLQPMLDTVDRLGRDRVAAIVIEPVFGLNGVPLPNHYIQDLRALCSQEGILLVFDEVFSGLGRMGTMFAAELSGVSPDFLCVSKTLTAGYAPLSAVLVTDEIYEAFDDPRIYFGLGSTTDAHPTSCAAGLATLNALQKEDAIDSGSQLGRYIHGRLESSLATVPIVDRVRHIGSYIGIDLNLGVDFQTQMMIKRHIQAECERESVLIDYTPYTLMLVPPYTMTSDEGEILAQAVAAVLRRFDPTAVDPRRLRPPSASGRR